MMKWVRVSGAACVLAFAVAAGANDATKKGDDTKKEDAKALTDASFVEMVASGNMMEVKLGEIGQVKGTDPRVKEFAKRMVVDHAAAGNDLRATAKSAGLTVTEKMLDKHQKHVDMFANYKGESFDRDYMKHMVEGHQKTADLLTKGTNEVKDANLKAFATKTLPVVQDHLKMAQDIEKGVKK